MVLAFLTVAGMAQTKSARAFLSYSVFDVPGVSPYIETSLAFDCNSLEYVETEKGRFHSEVNVTVYFKKGADIVKYDKYTISSPVLTDTSNIFSAFIDQQRYFLPTGDYEMVIEIKDANSSHTLNPTVQNISIAFPAEGQYFSDIQLVESYKPLEKGAERPCAKNGLDIVPMIHTFYPSHINKLSYYTEIYNSDKVLGKGEKYLFMSYIETHESLTRLEQYSATKRITAQEVNVVMNNIDISELPTGNYHLVLETRNKQNEVIASKSVFFQRDNINVNTDLDDISHLNIERCFTRGITSIDSLRMYILCMEPVSSEAERDYAFNLVKTDDVKTMQQYMHHFWAKRYPINPAEAWQNYYAKVLYVNKVYPAINKKGWQSDRGRVYLKYGAPDKISDSYNEPGAYPYEIWHYQTLNTKQRNKRFVFMTLDIVTNDFFLLHSDATGEVYNPRWTTDIYKRTYGTYFDYGVDNAAQPNSFGDRALELWNNPR